MRQGNARRTESAGIVARVLITMLMLSAATAAHAQSPQRAYDVELIIFRPLQPTDLDERQWLDAERELAKQRAKEMEARLAAEQEQQWPALPPIDDEMLAAPAAEDALPIEAPGAAPEQARSTFPPLQVEPDWRAPLPERHTMLEPVAVELAEEVRRLRLSRGLRPMWHARWRQFAFSRDEANAMAVEFEADGMTVSGTISVAAERRLHLELDLTLQAEDAVPYRLQRAAVMARNETHYVDHPAFGVLCRIVRGEFPEDYPAGIAAPVMAGAAVIVDPDRRMTPWLTDSTEQMDGASFPDRSSGEPVPGEGR